MRDEFGAEYSDDGKILRDFPHLNISRNATYVVREGCETIEWNGSGCLEKLVIPKSVRQIELKGDNDYIEEIEVDSENPYLTSIDGNLYSKDGKKLIAAVCWFSCQGGFMVIPESVESISFNAFEYNEPSQYFNRLIIPNNNIKVEDGEKIFIPHTAVVYVDESNLEWALNKLFTHNKVGVRYEADLYIDTIENYMNTNVFEDEETIIKERCILTSDHKKLCGVEDKEIEDIHIPEGVEYITTSAFDGCYNLKNVSFPSTLKGIGDLSFRTNRSLEKLVFPEKTSYIGNLAFGFGPQIIEFCGKIGHIGYQAFVDCTSVNTIIFHKGFEVIKDMDFSPSSLEGKTIKLPISCKSKLTEYYKEWIKKYHKKNPWCFFEE